MHNLKTNNLNHKNSVSFFDDKKHWNCLFLYPKFIENYSQNNDKEVLETHFNILLGIALELEKRRENFITTGNLKDLFATAYFHTCYFKIEQILDGVYLYPIEKIKQISFFYQSYHWNRAHWENNQKNLVEKHWITHFQKTEKKFPAFNYKKYIGHVLATGIEAHIDYDLPRALSHAFQNRNLKSIENNVYLEAIYEEFLKTEVIFEKVTDKTNADIEKAGLCNKIWLDIFSKSYGKLITKTLINPFTREMIYTDNDVIAKRITAWKKAATNIEFLGKDEKILQPQPTISTEELESNGKAFLSNFFSKLNN